VTEVIQVAEVFRIAARGGPVIIVNAPESGISPGTILAAVDHADLKLNVIAVDFPSRKLQEEGKIAVVVQPDHDEIQPGLELEVSGSLEGNWARLTRDYP
jgi:hypothetical protein